MWDISINNTHNSVRAKDVRETDWLLGEHSSAQKAEVAYNIESILEMPYLDFLRDYKKSQRQDMIIYSAKNNELNFLKYLLGANVSVEFESNGLTPTDVAYKNGHYDIVLELLNENAKIPKGFDFYNSTPELTSFIKDMNFFHHNFETIDIQEERKNFNELKYLYDMNNKSLAMKILENFQSKGNIEIAFEMIRTLQLNFDSDEIINIKNLLYKNYCNPSMLILLNNCFCTNQPSWESTKYIAFDWLSDFVKCEDKRIVLEVAAAVREISIHFDCTIAEVPEKTDFKSAYLKDEKLILVAARKWNDSIVGEVVKNHLFYSLYLYALDVIKANTHEEEQRKEIDKGIQLDSGIIETMKTKLPLLQKQNDPLTKLSELKVELNEKISKINEQEAEYREKEKEVNEKIAVIENIRKNFDEEISQKHIILKICLGIMIILILAVIILAYYNTKSYKWESLSSEDKEKIRAANIFYKGVQIKFGELFSKTSTVYNYLPEDYIKDALGGHTDKLTLFLTNGYSSFVHLNWNNMTSNLRKKLLTSTVNYQGQFETFGSLVTEESNSLKHLTTDDVRDLFNQHPINISSPQIFRDEFYIDRLFTNEHDITKTVEQIIQDAKKKKVIVFSERPGEGKTNVMQNLWQKLRNLYRYEMALTIDLRKHTKSLTYSEGEKFASVDDVEKFLSTKIFRFNEFEHEFFLEKLNAGNVYLLYDGFDELTFNGRCTVLNIIGHIVDYTQNLQFISTRPRYKDQIKNELRENYVEIFRFEELTTDKKIEFIIIFSIVKSGFVIDNKFKLDAKLTNAVKTQEYGEVFKLLIELPMKNETIANEAIKTIRESQLIINKIEEQSDKNITNPQHIKMIVQISNGENSSEQILTDIYSIYKTFVDISFRDGNKKYPDAIGFTNLLLIFEAYQAYAIRLLFAHELENQTYFDLNDIEIMKSIEKVSKQEISRSGVLIFFPDNEHFDFIHRSFADFFIAQFLTDNCHFDVSDADTRVRIFLLNKVLFCRDYHDAKNFIISRNKQEIETLQFVNSQTERIKYELNDIKSIEVLSLIEYSEFFYFFEKSHNIDISRSLNENFFRLSDDDIKILILNWDNIRSYFKPDNFGNFFKTPDVNDTTIFQRLILFATEVNLEAIISKAKEYFSKDERSEFLKVIDSTKQNYLHSLAQHKSFRDLNILIKFINNTIEKDFNDLLNPKSEENFLVTPLHFAMLNNDERAFEVMADFYKERFHKAGILTKIIVGKNLDEIDGRAKIFLQNILKYEHSQTSEAVRIFLRNNLHSEEYNEIIDLSSN